MSSFYLKVIISCIEIWYRLRNKKNRNWVVFGKKTYIYDNDGTEKLWLNYTEGQGFCMFQFWVVVFGVL